MRTTPPTRLTRLPQGVYCSPPESRRLDGNEWVGTISDVGGHARRIAQHAQAQEKVLGRRRERRRRNREPLEE